MLDITACLGRTRWTAKDQTKARRATKYIGRGSALSSTNAYARAIGPALANCGHYTTSDVVWISSEGESDSNYRSCDFMVLRCGGRRAGLRR
jgi:hypothetical protein